MLLIAIPKAQSAGTCRINGTPAEYRVIRDHFEFRYEGGVAWERRFILDAFPDGDLIRYSCDDGPNSTGPYAVLRPQPPAVSDEQFYWLAVNGSSCAASAVPMPPSVVVRPTPEQLIGFRSRSEQLATQRFLLTAPVDQIRMFMEEQMPAKIKNGEVVYLTPDNPEPPTAGATIWQCGPTSTGGEREPGAPGMEPHG